MDHNDKLLISLLNLSYDSVESIHSTSDDSNHLSIFVTLARRNMNCPFCGNVKLLSNGFYRRKIFSILLLLGCKAPLEQMD